MAGIRQFQRRAIEALASYLKPVVLEQGQRFFLDGQEVFFRGISVGEGTCSDMHDVNFSVFSDVSDGAPSLSRKLLKISGAVFLREARTRNERNAAHAQDGQQVLVVEALHHQSLESGAIVFRRVGKKKAYIPVPS